MVALADVCEFWDHRRIPIESSLRNVGQYPYYGANGIQGWVDDFIFDDDLVLLAEDGGHFGSRTRPIAYKIKGKAWVNNHAHVLKPKSNCDIDFLHHILRYFDVTPFINGATRPKLTKSNASEIPIPLPSLEEQRRIAGILERADRLRRLRLHALEISDTYLQSVFLEMFGDPSSNAKGWDVVALKDICDQVVDCPHSTPSYLNSQIGFPCIRSSDLQNGRFDFSSTKFVDLADYTDRIQRLEPTEGDVIYCREGERFGNAARVPKGIKVCLGQRVMLLRAKQTICDSAYLLRLVVSDAVYQMASRLVFGSTTPHVNVQDIKEFLIPLPPLELQRKFASVVQRHEHLRAQQLEGVRLAQGLYDALLHNAFAG